MDCTWFVQNGVYFLDHIKIRFIVGVFNTHPPPRDIGQLACRQCVSDITSSWKTHKTNAKTSTSTQTLQTLFASAIRGHRSEWPLTPESGWPPFYLWAYWQPIAGWWEAWSSLWARWTLSRVESRCPASPPAARTRSPHCPWSHLPSTLQSSPVDNQKKKSFTLKKIEKRERKEKEKRCIALHPQFIPLRPELCPNSILHINCIANNMYDILNMVAHCLCCEYTRITVVLKGMPATVITLSTYCTYLITLLIYGYTVKDWMNS